MKGKDRALEKKNPKSKALKKQPLIKSLSPMNYCALMTAFTAGLAFQVADIRSMIAQNAI